MLSDVLGTAAIVYATCAYLISIAALYDVVLDAALPKTSRFLIVVFILTAPLAVFACLIANIYLTITERRSK